MIDRRAHGAAGVQDVIEEHDDLVGDIEGNARVVDGAAGQERVQIVAIQRDVHLADGDILAVALLDDFGQPFGDVRPAGAHTDERHLIEAAILLGHLAGEAFENDFDLPGVKDAFLFAFRIFHWRLGSSFP